MSAAEPMAKPLPIAAVVLPSASSASVRSRTSGGQPGHLGDAARVVGHRPVGVDTASEMPRVESMPTAARRDSVEASPV